MKNQDKVMKYLNNIENPYIMKNENMNVRIEYSDNNKTFNECMQNILKTKRKIINT